MTKDVEVPCLTQFRKRNNTATKRRVKAAVKRELGLEEVFPDARLTPSVIRRVLTIIVDVAFRGYAPLRQLVQRASIDRRVHSSTGKTTMALFTPSYRWFSSELDADASSFSIGSFRMLDSFHTPRAHRGFSFAGTKLDFFLHVLTHELVHGVVALCGSEFYDAEFACKKEGHGRVFGRLHDYYN
jgi:hypothetical protein